MITPDDKDRAAAKELRYQAELLADGIERNRSWRDTPIPGQSEEWIKHSREICEARIAAMVTMRRQLLNRAARLENGTAATHAGGER